MTNKNEEYLFKTYKTLYGSEERRSDPAISCLFFGFECGDGWFDIIDKLSEKIENVNNLNLGFIIVADQVKEKFGTLRFYYHAEATGDDLTEEQLRRNTLLAGLVEDAIGIAGMRTEYTCEVCGERGKLRDDGWIKCLCDKHAEKGE